jgi:3'(2'), 5'-bisphosphate nucleotidase
MNKMQDLLSLAIQAARKGAGEILDVYSRDFDVEFKADSSPLTLADRNAHVAISSMIASAGLPILSEEGKHMHYAERQGWQRFWLVDPLDGTKEFVKRNGEFTVNIALIDNGFPVMGVILVPVTGKLYYAAEGIGAFITSIGPGDEKLSGKPLPLSPSGQDIYRVVCSRSHMSPETEEFVESLRPEHPEMEYVSIGSSLKLCLIAEGAADLYPRFGPTMEWDTAAGQAIVEISGGYVRIADSGQRMRYNKENLLNPWFIAGRK